MSLGRIRKKALPSGLKRSAMEQNKSTYDPYGSVRTFKFEIEGSRCICSLSCLHRWCAVRKVLLIFYVLKTESSRAVSNPIPGLKKEWTPKKKGQW